MISGALLIGNDKFTFRRMIKKYIPRILICFICWNFIYYFYENRNFTLGSIIVGIKNLLTGTSYSHLWYLYLLLGLYVITPILNKLVLSFDQKKYLYCLILGFFVTAFLLGLGHLTNYDFMKFLKPYKVFDVNVFVFYYLLGYYLKTYPIKNKKIIISTLIFSMSGVVGKAILGNYWGI